ncbi:MAG: InlB B-repeat-containing protein [Treponema sp.]
MKKISLLALCLLASLIGCKTDATSSEDENPSAKKYTVNFSANPKEGGTVTAALKDGKPVNNGDKVVSGTEIVFTAMPKNGYGVSIWSGSGDFKLSNESKTAELTLKKDIDVRVSFAKKPTSEAQTPALFKLTFAAKPENGGTVTAKTKDAPLTGGAMIAENTEIMFTAEAKDGYEIDDWSGAPSLKVGADKKTATLTLTGDANVTVTFNKKAPAPSAKQYKVTFTASGGGSVTAATKDGKTVTSGGKVYSGTEVVFTATPNKGYYLKNWSGADSLNTGTDTLTVTKDITVTAHFSELIEGKNWEAEGEIKDSKGKPHNVKLTISDEKYLSFFSDGVSYTPISVDYDKSTSSLIAWKQDEGGKDAATSKLFTIKLLSKPTPPADWKIQFEGEVKLEEESKPSLHIKSGTEADITVKYDDHTFITNRL